MSGNVTINQIRDALTQAGVFPDETNKLEVVKVVSALDGNPIDENTMANGETFIHMRQYLIWGWASFNRCPP